MRTSTAFKDGEPPEDAEDPEEEAKKITQISKTLMDDVKQIEDATFLDEENSE